MLASAAPAWPRLQRLSIKFGKFKNCYTWGSKGVARGLEALAEAAVHWPRMTAFELCYMDLYSKWGLRWLADIARTSWPGLTRLDLDTCGDLSQQIQYLQKLTSLRELWLPGCTLSIESDLPALRKLPRLVSLVLSRESRLLLQGADMWQESVEGQMRNFCCLSCEREKEEG